MGKKIRINSIIGCLILAMIGNTIFGKTTVNAAMESNKISQVVYVDGVKFLYTIENDGTTVVESMDDENYGKLELSNKGEADVEVMSEDGDLETFNVEIEDLTEDNVDIVVQDDKDKLIEEYDDIDEILEDSYDGQTAVATVTVISFTTLLKVLVIVSATVVIGGITYHAATKAYEAIRQSRQSQKYYYRASLSNGSVYIAYTSKLTQKQAAARIKRGQNIYTYTGSQARAAVLASGKRVSKAEIDKNRKKGKIYFYHYHTSPKNGSHAWYGKPYTK